jgi:hypothetical protein
MTKPLLTELKSMMQAHPRLGDDQDIETELNPGKPTILFRAGQISKMVEDGQAALMASCFPIYERGDLLVHPVIKTVKAHDEQLTQIAQLKPVDPTYLRLTMNRASNWNKWDVRSKKEVPIDPPYDVARSILSQGADEWPFPTIKGVIGAPTMRPDGSILSQPGFDESTGLLLVGAPPMPTIPDSPTRQDALAAVALLEDLLREFPLVDEASKSAVLSGFITPVVRGAFPVSPMHVSAAPTAGTGKSYLWDIAAAIAIGQRMPIIAAGPHSEELEKRLGAQLIGGQSLICIDNVNGELQGAALCQFIERPGIQRVRVLGKTENIDIDLNGTTFFANGNNITFSSELARRTIKANLDAQMENPDLREFRGNPMEQVLADRGAFIAAALTICRAYIVAGQPAKAPGFASFEGWSNIVRSALIWLGRADPVTPSIRTEAPDRDLLNQVLQAWSDVLGIGREHRVSMRELLRLATEDLRNALLAAVQSEDKNKKYLEAASLGYWARKYKGRVVSGLRLVSETDRKGVARWWVESVSELKTVAPVQPEDTLF